MFRAAVFVSGKLNFLSVICASPHVLTMLINSAFAFMWKSPFAREESPFVQIELPTPTSLCSSVKITPLALRAIPLAATLMKIPNQFAVGGNCKKKVFQLLLFYLRSKSIKPPL